MQSQNLEKIVELRHILHRRAELSLHEVETGRILRDFLRKNTSLEIVERDGWFYGVKRGAMPQLTSPQLTSEVECAEVECADEGALADLTSEVECAEVGALCDLTSEVECTEGECAGAVAFRADMDALPMEEGIELSYASERPGVSHKCGHDGHCAALCGLALELEGRETDRPVYFIFQKAEEIGGGGELAAELIDEEGIREVYAFHNLSGYPEKAVVYRRGLTQPASEGMKILFFGRQSHASAPEEGINPSEVIAETVLYIRELLEAEHRGMVLCTVTGMEAGSGDFGISAGEGSLSVTLRALEEEELVELEGYILAFVGERCAEKGIRTEVRISDRFPETRNWDAGVDRVLAAAERIGAARVPMERMWRASEDFGHYLKRCGGAMFYVGNGEAWPALHTAEYDFNDRILETAVDVLVGIAGVS